MARGTAALGGDLQPPSLSREGRCAQDTHLGPPVLALRTRGPHSARCVCSWGVIELTSWAPPDLVIRGVPGSRRLSLSSRGIGLHSEEPWFLLGEEHV